MHLEGSIRNLPDPLLSYHNILELQVKLHVLFTNPMVLIRGIDKYYNDHDDYTHDK